MNQPGRLARRPCVWFDGSFSTWPNQAPFAILTIMGSKRADVWPISALYNEENLSTAQPPPIADPWIQSTHGNAGRKKHPEASPGQGPPAPDDNDSSQAARLKRRRQAVVASVSYRFGKTDRLRHPREFVGIQRHGVRWQSGHFVFYGLAGGPARPARLGITVSRRVGNAVERNRIKRRVRECYRLKLRAMLPQGAEIVIIARAGAAEIEPTQTRLELLAGAAGLMRRLDGALKRESL
jgi:ribonuclease P protein component